MSENWEPKVTGASVRLASLSIYNPAQNNLRKIKKSKRVRQNQKTLISVFFNNFYGLVPKIYFCQRDWVQGCLPMQFWDFFNTVSSYFARSVKSVGCSYELHLHFFVLSLKRNDWQTFKCSSTNKPFI